MTEETSVEQPEAFQRIALLPYKTLSTLNPQCAPALWERIRLLYKGGYELKGQVSQFIVQGPNETAEAFTYRLNRTSYIAYFGQIIDYLVAALFEEALHVTPAGDDSNPDTPGEVPDKLFYPAFAKDCDRNGTTLAMMMRAVITTALLLKRGYISVDMPQAPEAITRYEESKLGAGRGYCWEEQPESLIDWGIGPDGEWTWAILQRRVCEREAPWSDRSTYRERFKIWLMQAGCAECMTLETEPINVDSKPADALMLRVIQQPVRTSFTKIPIVKLELPDGLWAGNKIGPLAEEILQRRSDLFGAIGQSLQEIGYIKLGPEVPGFGQPLPSEVQQDPHRGDNLLEKWKAKGFVPIGYQDEIGFASPKTQAYTVAQGGVTELRDEMYRTVTAMSMSLDSTASVVGRSGESKREDRAATEKVLLALGEYVRKAAIDVYTIISIARGETVIWRAFGLSKFNLEQRVDLTTEALQLESIPIPSETFQTEYKTSLAFALLPSASPETKAVIQKEIQAGIKESEKTKDLLSKMAETFTKEPSEPILKPGNEQAAEENPEDLGNESAGARETAA